MSMTRTQFRTKVIGWLDTAASTRWSNTEIDAAGSFVSDREWRNILTANPFYQTAQRTPTSDSSGRYLISALSSGSGNSAERFFRILMVAIDGAVYQEVPAKDYLLATSLNVGYRVWFRDGLYVKAVPVQATKTLSGADGIYVNWLPTNIGALALDADTVIFPDSYEEMLAIESAAWLMAKGGAETQGTMELRAMADIMRMDMISDIQRVSINPLRVTYADLPNEWGG